MKARSIMTVNVSCVLPELSLSLAWQVMQELRVRHLPVVDGAQNLVGILSDRDVLLRARRADDGSIEIPDLRVGQAMTSQLITCDPGSSSTRMASLMLEHKIDALPITTHDGKLRGLVTSSDLLALLLQSAETIEALPLEFVMKAVAR